MIWGTWVLPANHAGSDPMDVQLTAQDRLVNRVVAEAEVIETAVMLARRIARNAPVTVPCSCLFAPSRTC